MIKSFNVGRQGENKVKSLFSEWGFIFSSNDTDNSIDGLSHDLSLDFFGTPLLFEIKMDAMERKTGNVAIEYWNCKQEKPSGVWGTNSDFWLQVFKDPLSVWLTPTNKLMLYLETTEPFKHIKAGGDKNSDMKIYKTCDILPALFHRIDNLKRHEFIKLIRELRYV